MFAFATLCHASGTLFAAIASAQTATAQAWVTLPKGIMAHNHYTRRDSSSACTAPF